MKTKLLKSLLSNSFIVISLLLIACDKNDDEIQYDVTGTYIGTISGNTESTQPATAIVTNFENHVKVYCFSDDFEATTILDIYENGDNMMVCLTGDEFEDMYGHMLDEEHMNHNGSNWMQHLNEEHQEGDEHFGFFNMMDHTFEFTFKLSNGDFHFKGSKS